MDQDLSTAVTFDASAITKDEMNWDAYAEHYDQMCEMNPAYQENLAHLLKRIPLWNLPEQSVVCDLGAGTGNYICALANHFKRGKLYHVDFDARMNEFARAKYLAERLSNITIVQDHVLNFEMPNESVDLITCINSIYAVHPQTAVLERVRRWLKPDGIFFAIDFGRKQRTLDWAIYLFRESMRARSIGKYAKGLIEGREVMKQNQQTTAGQKTGRYWLHSTEEFGSSLEAAGFRVEELFPCYRGYADLAVCRPR